MLLLDLNPHDRDRRISFISEGHIYKVDSGEDTYTSVTTFIKSFFYPFDSDKIIQNMIRSGSFGKKYPNKTPQQVKNEWKQSGLEAASWGSLLHLSIENFYNSIPQSIDSKIQQEYDYFLGFHENHVKPQGLKPYRTEWYIFIEEYKIAGSIDMVYELPNGNLCIYDWKRSKKIEYRNSWKKMGKEPIQHLDDCNYYHYSLQLNLYKYILETKYNKNVECLRLIFLHNQYSEPIIVNVPDLQDEIKSMLEHFSVSRLK